MSEENPPPPQADNKLTSDHCETLSEALDLLYIKGNMSGRLKFLQEWPDVAAYIFSEELIHIDTEGGQDAEHREALEEEAIDRRIAFLDLLKTFEEKSVNKGVLQAEYVDELIKKLGRDLSLYLYAPRFVDRIFPPPAEEQKQEEAVQQPVVTAPVQTPEVKEPDVQPIDMTASDQSEDPQS